MRRATVFTRPLKDPAMAQQKNTQSTSHEATHTNPESIVSRFDFVGERYQATCWCTYITGSFSMNLKKGNRLGIPTMIQSFRDILRASRADKRLDLKLANNRIALTCSCRCHTLKLLLHQRRLFWTGSSNTSQHASPLQVLTQSSRLLFFSSASNTGPRHPFL